MGKTQLFSRFFDFSPVPANVHILNIVHDSRRKEKPQFILSSASAGKVHRTKPNEMDFNNF
jgi:hypothetical protein